MAEEVIIQYMEFKGKEQRAICYINRDLYFDCLDKNNNKSEDCRKFLAKFEEACGNKWTDHFIKKRDYIKFKDRLQKEGIEALDNSKLKKSN